MNTIVIDLQGDLTGFDPVRPFFYPFLREDTLFLVEPKKGVFKIKDAASQTIKILKRQGWRKNTWQVIVLVNIVDMSIEDEISVCCGSLAYQLDQIKEYIATPLEVAGRRPAQSFVVAIDKLIRNYRKEPVAPFGSNKWHIDTHGYSKDTSCEDEVVFTEDDLNNIAGCWPDDIDFAGERNVSSLVKVKSKAIKDKINKRIRASLKVIDKLADAKIGYVKKCFSQADSRFFSVDVLNDLKKEFKADLDDYKQNNAHIFAKYRPGKHFKRLLKQRFSLLAISDQKIICVRYPALEWQKEGEDTNSTRMEMLKYAYFIVSLIENANDFRDQGDKLLVVDEIDIDREPLDVSMYNSTLAWETVTATLDTRNTEDREVTISSVVNNCMCNVHLDEFNPPVQEKITTWSQWIGWRDSVENKIKDYITIADSKLDTSNRQLREGRRVEEKAIKIPPGGFAYADDEISKLRNDLYNELYTDLSYDWLMRVGTTSEKLRDIFSSELSRSQRIILVFTAATILLAPPSLIIYKSKGTTGFVDPESIPTIIMMVLFSVISVLAISLLRRIKRRNLLERSKEIIKMGSTSIKKLFTDNQAHLRKVCELTVAIQNKRAIEQAHEDARSYRSCTTYFISKLNEHKLWLRKFCLDASHSQPGIRKPPVMPGYSGPPQSDRAFEIIYGNNVVEIGAKKSSYGSSLMPGLKSIKINNDINESTDDV